MKHLFLTLLSIITWCCYAQEATVFSVNNHFYLKGNSALIGNNIISTHQTKAFNDPKKFNDLLKLKYVDIDNDNSTFSSSQAKLIIPENTKIRHAALYWSAIYPYNFGKTKVITLKNKTKQRTYFGDETRDSNFYHVLLKTPNNNYTPIKGSIIFNGLKHDKFENTKPYVCYADVTPLLQNIKNPSGNYTLANMKATQGFTAGGCAGGWLLYVIYEDETETAKSFTTYNGFSDVFKTPVNILFQNFKAPEYGSIKTSLLLGALEGDLKFKTDYSSFLDSDKKDYIPLFNKARPRNNFFNSSISINDKPFLNRLPASRNTLGFDLLKIEVPNSNNTVISNNATDATVQFNSKADRFYLFFVAFETEISPIFLEGKENEGSILVLNKENEIKIDAGVEKIRNLKSIKIPSISKGYYLVTNVFSVKKNAEKWMSFLEEKGHSPKSYVNPRNGWHYIYLNINMDPSIIYQNRKELSKIDYFEDIWILKINL
ncbi:MAG: hypothetical protein HKO01_03695 [Flaviramulus sp.]|nr:hypothetical protein [Flaviramulus sp.]NNC49620.1 hypothetical protein [Flaviramulus sp.]